jgi:DNA mismatch repair protein MLH3
MDAEIEKLDTSTQSHIRSTQILTSLPQIVSELLQNALDAGATSVEIGIDAQEWLCWVKDNGHGIGKNNLDSIGRDGYAGRYSTSKSYAQNLMNAESTFGFRGEGQFEIHGF